MPKPASTPRKSKSSLKLPKLIEKYYEALKALAHQNVFHEMGTRNAFFALLLELGKQHGWTLIAEHEKKVGGRGV